VENTGPAAPSLQVTALPNVAVSIDWSEINALEARHVNQVVTQIGNPTPDGLPDGILVGIGVVFPPIYQAANPEAAKKMAEQLQGTSLTATAHGRFHMSRGFLDALIKTLQTTADQYDSIVSQVEAAKAATSGQE